MVSLRESRLFKLVVHVQVCTVRVLMEFIRCINMGDRCILYALQAQFYNVAVSHNGHSGKSLVVWECRYL